MRYVPEVIRHVTHVRRVLRWRPGREFSTSLGLLPYAWSLLLQFYFAPKVLYRIREGTALGILAFVVGATLLELMTRGNTVGF